MNLCKTKHCSRNAVPEGFGYCNVCFTRIMEVRKIKALERIANALEKNDFSSPTNLTSGEFTPTIIKKNKIKSEETPDDFIPNIDISNVKTSGVKIETKKDKKNIQKIKERLSKIL